MKIVIEFGKPSRIDRAEKMQRTKRFKDAKYI